MRTCSDDHIVQDEGSKLCNDIVSCVYLTVPDHPGAGAMCRLRSFVVGGSCLSVATGWRKVAD